VRASRVKRDAQGGTTFGYTLRAARLVFKWHDGLRAYMRITDLGEGRWRVELSDGPSMPTTCGKEQRSCWWEGEGDPVSLSPALTEIRDSLGGAPLVGWRSMVLNDDGELVQASGGSVR
jgi:hypothetical protein